MYKNLTALLLLAPALVFAQAPAKTDAKPAAAAKPAPAAAAKPAVAAKPAASTPAKAAAAPAAKAKAPAKPPTKSRTEIQSTAKNMAAGIEAAEVALTPAELAVAQQVHVGVLPCELGNAVTVVADPAAPGYFNVQNKAARYRMFPVVTSTGAIRLEDQKAGAVWLQLGNKSMLMNQKLGQRLADECMSPSQMAVADRMRSNPAPSLLDSAPATAGVPAGSQPPAAVAYPTGPTPPAASPAGPAAAAGVVYPTGPTPPAVAYPTGPTPPARKASAAK